MFIVRIALIVVFSCLGAWWYADKQMLLGHRWSTSFVQRPRAAFVYLVHADRGQALSKSLHSVQVNFLSAYPGYEVILFHDKYLENYDDLVPKNMTLSRWVLLEDFDLLPPYYTHEDHQVQTAWYCSPIGICSACSRFRSCQTQR